MATITNYGNSSWVQYSPEIYDSNTNQKRNLSRPQGRNVNICGGMFRIQNFPLHVLGSTRSFVPERRTWHSPNLIHRFQHCTEILTQFILTKHFTRRVRADTILSPPRQYSFLGGFVTNILRDFLSSGTSLRLQTIGIPLHEDPPYVMF